MVELPFALGAAGLVVVLLGLSAFFSSSETAIFTATDGSDDRSTDRGRGDDAAPAAADERAATLAALRGDPHRLLVTLLVGNNLVNVAISSVVTVTLVQALPPGPAVTLATVVASSLVLVFGEIVPKSYGLGNADAWSLTVAGPLRVVELALLPVVVAFDLATRALTARLGGAPDIERPLVDE